MSCRKFHCATVTHQDQAAIQLSALAFAPENNQSTQYERFVAVKDQHALAQEAMGNGDENDAVVTLAVGGVVAEDGTISLASFLPKGAVEGNFYDTTLHSPETAEYHLAMHNHGPLDPNIAEDMLTSFRVGCSDERLPSYYPAAAIKDGVKGSFDCKTVQVALFPLN